MGLQRGNGMSDDLVKRLRTDALGGYCNKRNIKQSADRIEALEAALIEADALAEQCELFADGKLYSMNPVLEAREAYRQAREATR